MLAAASPPVSGFTGGLNFCPAEFMSPSLKRRWKRAAVAAVLVVPLVLVLIVAWRAGTSLSAPARRSVGALPTDLRGRAVEFESASGSTIRGWLIPGERGAGAVVLMHGVRGSRLNMLGRARFLSAAGYTVLLFDFQAHGESGGSRITTGYLESRDARAALDFVRAQAPPIETPTTPTRRRSCLRWSTRQSSRPSTTDCA